MYLFVAWLFLLWPWSSATCSAEKRNRKIRTVEEESCFSNGGCVSICCPPGQYIRGTGCREDPEFPAGDLELPPVYTTDFEPAVSDNSVWNYTLIYHHPCTSGSYALDPEERPEDEFYLFENGSIYQPIYLNGTMLNFGDYCFASVLGENQSYTVIAVCFKDFQYEDNDPIPVFYPVAMILSTIFLIGTFAAYSVIPELYNIHGLTLRAYVAVLFIAYVALSVVQFGDQDVAEMFAFCTLLGNNDFSHGLRQKNILNNINYNNNNNNNRLSRERPFTLRECEILAKTSVREIILSMALPCLPHNDNFLHVCCDN